MKQEPKANRRIVSRGAYAKAQLKRLGLLLGATCLLFALPFSIQGYWNDFLLHTFYLRSHHVSTFHHTMIALSSLLLIPVSVVFFGALILGMMKRSARISHVTPLTRANTADLPAPDSLVRASQEPAQAQEAVLLRAAVRDTQTETGEQLLRASGGQA